MDLTLNMELISYMINGLMGQVALGCLGIIVFYLLTRFEEFLAEVRAAEEEGGDAGR